jgi:acetyltransferase-like isoleucine patch superfamily enzyme
MRKLLKKIYHKLFQNNNNTAVFINLKKGTNLTIDPSAILTTAGDGEIVLEGNNYIGRQVEIGTTGNITIGFNSSIQDRCILLGDVEIGNYCTFAPNVYMSSGRHYYNHKPNYYIKDQDEMVASDKELSSKHSKKIVIGDDCWLGINSVIMSGVTIGRGCIIGANSVVTKNIEPFSVVAGSPAKLIKQRLNFIQKNKVSFSNEEDLPNFYKGFFINQENLKESILNEGIYSSNQFVVYLNSNCKKINIKLQKLLPENITLIHNDQIQIIESNEFITLTFDNSNKETSYYNFSVKEIDDKQKKCLLINSIEVLN